jgi:hypothetical protein
MDISTKRPDISSNSWFNLFKLSEFQLVLPIHPPYATFSEEELQEREELQE